MKKIKPYQLLIVGAMAVGVAFLMSCGTKDPISSEEITPPGGKIIYVQQTIESDYDIYTMNTDGSDRKPVISSNYMEAMPHCACGGDKIAFSWNIDGDPEIFIMKMDGSQPTQLTYNDHSDFWPRWSPGDSLIAFHRYDGSLGNWEIWVMNPENGNEYLITDHSANDICPGWSADGARLVFQSDRVGPDYDLYVVEVGQGAAVETLTQNDFEDGAPQYSHDGEWIVFVSQDRSIDENDSEIFKMRSDGTEVTQLTHNTVYDATPSWSPDDSWIVFRSVEGGHYDIFIMRADGAGLRNITKDTIIDAWPDWTN